MKGRRVLYCVGAALLALTILRANQQPPPAVEKANPADQPSKGKEKPKPQRKRVVTDLSGFDLLEPSKLRRQTTVVGATRGLPRPVVLAPRLGKLYGSNPTFAWSYEGKASNFVFILWNDAKEEIFRAEVNGSTYQYPPTATELKAEKTYFWAVEAAVPIMGSSQSAPVGFIMVSPSQRDEIEKRLRQAASTDPYQAGLARARVFTDYRLWYDAVGAYSDLIARYPDRAELYEQRGTIYSQLDVARTLAEQDFAQAEELQDGKK
jgi:hypothetical protein